MISCILKTIFIQDIELVSSVEQSMDGMIRMMKKDSSRYQLKEDLSRELCAKCHKKLGSVWVILIKGKYYHLRCWQDSIGRANEIAVLCQVCGIYIPYSAHFSIRVPPDDIRNFCSIKDMIHYLKNR